MKKMIERSNLNSLPVSEFCLGVAKGLLQGVYESGEELVLFTELVIHPIKTSGQIVDSVELIPMRALKNLVEERMRAGRAFAIFVSVKGKGTFTISYNS
jgi:hypothetical protein